LQTEVWLKRRLVFTSVTAGEPGVYGPLVRGPAARALLLFFSRTWIRFLVLFGGAMVLIRLSMALPFFLLSDLWSPFSSVFRGAAALSDLWSAGFPRPLFYRRRLPARSVHGPLVRRRESFPLCRMSGKGFDWSLKEGPGAVPVPPRMTLLRGFAYAWTSYPTKGKNAMR
jgi:hypothetical protein